MHVLAPGVAPPAHAGAVVRGRGGLAMLAGVHHDHQVPRQVPADCAAGRRLRLLPRLRQQIHLEEGIVNDLFIITFSQKSERMSGDAARDVEPKDSLPTRTREGGIFNDISTRSPRTYENGYTAAKR